MTGQSVFLAEVVGRLERAGIAYMIVGSVASGAHGEPRGTYDVDIVIDATAERLETFVASFGEEFYVSSDAARDALIRKSMFNVIDPASGQKADLIVRGDAPFDLVEFGRRRRERVMDLEVELSTPEDVILSKLKWSKESGSERQIRDALGVALAQWKRLDQAYLDEWAAVLGVGDLLERVRRDVGAVREGE